MSSGLTEYQVREALAKREPPIKISHDQLARWLEWGLLERDDTGQWAPSTIEKVVSIHELGKTVTSNARRVIRLHAQSVRVAPPDPNGDGQGGPGEVSFAVPPESLRRAMVKVASQIRPHLKKMKRVDAAVAHLPGQSGLPGRQRRPASRRLGWRLPYREDWPGVLERASGEEFAHRANLQYYVAALLRTLGPGTTWDLREIPFEEQIVLLTVRDLAAREQLRATKAKPNRRDDDG